MSDLAYVPTLKLIRALRGRGYSVVKKKKKLPSLEGVKSARMRPSKKGD